MKYAKPLIKSFSESELQNTIMASASGFWSGSANNSGWSTNVSYTYPVTGSTSVTGNVGYNSNSGASGGISVGIKF